MPQTIDSEPKSIPCVLDMHECSKCKKGFFGCVTEADGIALKYVNNQEAVGYDSDLQKENDDLLKKGIVTGSRNHKVKVDMFAVRVMLNIITKLAERRLSNNGADKTIY